MFTIPLFVLGRIIDLALKETLFKTTSVELIGRNCVSLLWTKKIERVEVAESLKFLDSPAPAGPDQPSVVPSPGTTNGPSTTNGDTDTPRISKRTAQQLK